MKKIEKYFGSVNMTWKKVIIFAVITAVYTAVMALIPWFEDTSFSDIAVTLECWILFAVFIAVNCKTWYESALKIFVFFLISQPLIYLLQVPFSRLGWEIFQYYKYWFAVTLLTLPGGAIAFFVKKKDLPGALILSVATSALAWFGVSYSVTAIHNFPRHILSAVFCFALAVFLIIVLIKNNKLRLIASAITLAVLVYCAVTTVTDNTPPSAAFDLPEGEWTYQMEHEGIADISIEGSHVTVKPISNGESVLTFTSADGTVVEYYVTVDYGYMGVSPLK